MLPQKTHLLLRHLLSYTLHITITTFEIEPVGGGSINNTYHLIINGNLSLFCKINDRLKLPGLFEKEANGLRFIAKQNIIRTPAIIACTIVEDLQVLVLEWIDQGLKTSKFWGTFGEKLAQLHHISSDMFGFYEDNYIGSLPQSNSIDKTWVYFFITNRLAPQVKLAVDAGRLSLSHQNAFEQLYMQLNNLFLIEWPSLLHGDLWSGNFICDTNEQPVLIDPAVYFGHRSMDMAMTTLFGGFEKPFYDAYHHHFCLPLNYQEQWHVCNLYPLLIHLNLFGSSYLGPLEKLLKYYSNH